MKLQKKRDPSHTLNLSDLENVIGGETAGREATLSCPFCLKPQKVALYHGGRAICTVCNKQFIV